MLRATQHLLHTAISEFIPAPPAKNCPVALESCAAYTLITGTHGRRVPCQSRQHIALETTTQPLGGTTQSSVMPVERIVVSSNGLSQDLFLERRSERCVCTPIRESNSISGFRSRLACRGARLCPAREMTQRLCPRCYKTDRRARITQSS